MTEVTCNYRVPMSAQKIRGYAVSAWCIQNDHSLFSSIFRRKIYLPIRRQSIWISARECIYHSEILFVDVYAYMHYGPSCVCLHYVLAHLLQSVLCIWPTAMPQSCAAALCKQQVSQWDAKEEAWHCVRFFVINTSQTARERESCLPLIRQWEFTFKTYQYTLPFEANVDKSVVLLNACSHQV